MPYNHFNIKCFLNQQFAFQKSHLLLPRTKQQYATVSEQAIP